MPSSNCWLRDPDGAGAGDGARDQPDAAAGGTLQARFGPLYGESAVVAMHSGMTPAQRLKSWLAAHSGVARIVLGTRMAVFASMPQLKLIVVDEEHDPSYKSMKVRATRRATWRSTVGGWTAPRSCWARPRPSLESWHHSRPASRGWALRAADMPSRIGRRRRCRRANARHLPRVRRVDMNHQPKGMRDLAPAARCHQQRVAVASKAWCS
jgi:primosomal protein N' (replication factor Y)